MKEENVLVVLSLFLISAMSFGTMCWLADKDPTGAMLPQLVLIPVSIVSGLVGYLTKGVADKIKNLPKPPDEPKK